MGVVPTNQWLEEDFYQPVKICDRLTAYFNGQKPNRIYEQLLNFGMYKPTREAENVFKTLQKKIIWEKVDRLYHKYKSKWEGKEVPVFIFPVNAGGLLFRRNTQRKSGVSYLDKLFLFIPELDDPKELEALFVHEYHHVCRLNEMKNKMEENTLLDSMILEGLAEHAVSVSCGEDYLAPWCRQYSEKELMQYWDKFLKDKLEIKKREKSHDDLLFGKRAVPTLLGYAAGWNLVKKHYQTNPFSIKKSFSLSSNVFLKKF